MESYREYMEMCLANGERMPYSYELHCKEQVLERLEALLEDMPVGYEEPYMREEDVVSEMIWMIQEGEDIENGFYSWNVPDTDLVVLAPPALLAFLMGEYDLAIRLCEAIQQTQRNDEACELRQDSHASYLGGGTIRFCEACLLCRDMSPEQITYFREKGFLDVVNLWRENGLQFSEVHFCVDKHVAWEHMQKVLQNARDMGKVYEDTEDILILFLWYFMKEKMDENNPIFWIKLCDLFADSQEFKAIPEVLHAYARTNYRGEMGNYQEQYRLLAGMDMYYRYADSVNINQCVGSYISEIILERCEVAPKGKDYRKVYFSTMKKFNGHVTEEWLKDMQRLLKGRDYFLLEQAFKNGFLRKDCMDDYMEYCLLEKDYSGILSYLVQKKWRMEEVANGCL